MSGKITVTAADFIRGIGRWQSMALREPVYITHHGRERLVLLAPEQMGKAAQSGDEALTELAELRASWATLLEAMDEGYLAIDAYGRIGAANALAARLAGRAREDLSGRLVRDAFPEIFALILMDRLRRVLMTRKPEAFESSTAGAGLVLSVRVAPAPNGAIVLFHNITEQAELRRERERSTALEAALQRHPNLATACLDTRGRIQDVSESFARWLGFADGDLSGHRFTDLMLGGERLLFERALEGVLRENQPRQITVTLLDKRRNEAPFDITLSAVLADYIAQGVIGVAAPAHEERARPAS